MAEKYVLTLTREQAVVARDALELYARLKLGQFENITEKIMNFNPGDFSSSERREIANGLLKTVAKLILGEDEYGQPSGKKDLAHYRAWSIYTTLRHKMAWHDHPQGGMGVSFDKPYPFGNEQPPFCEVKD